MVQKDGSIGYFLGANSPGGFHSLYEGWMEESAAGACYILKGGPGCGKSTLMKEIGKTMEAAGWAAEYIWCSGDPDSLDGVRFPEKNVAIADGTAPHGSVTPGHNCLGGGPRTDGKALPPTGTNRPVPEPRGQGRAGLLFCGLGEADG